jgi:hypothetical protein
VDAYEWPAEVTSSMQLLTDKAVQLTVRLEKSSPAAGGLADLSILTLSAVRNDD